MSTRHDFTRAICVLHREKDRAYGPAWKRRGELISIVANIARKVDRLERLAVDGRPTRDETTIDTAVDLLVYGLKYLTYLADIDPRVAELLFSELATPPYSEGTEPFEVLLSRCDLSTLDNPGPTKPIDAVAAVVETFNELEAYLAAELSAEHRQRCVEKLCASAISLIGALRDDNLELFTAFIQEWQEDA